MLTVKEFLRSSDRDVIGIPSYCTANELVIEALLRQELNTNKPVLIEATANQVNQFGGYTGKQPIDFVEKVYAIADSVDFPRDRIILGGDHLGPLIWANEPETTAMEKAKDLVKLFVKAGYRKIHLDTSMKLADDPVDERLSDETIARRGVELYLACEEAYQDLLREDPSAMRADFIIGSEVPIPGGAQEEEDSISVTKPAAVEETLETYRKAFEEAGIDNAFDNIIGIVVQPGVEFGDDEVFQYNREDAANLVEFIKTLPGIVMEGHSTDYQTKESLRQMVEDGVGILKVGPALTFAMREGLFALSRIEEELFEEEELVSFPLILERAMLKNPGNWQKHYHGSDKELFLKRKYSLSDRARYYFSEETVSQAISDLLAKFEGVKIPMGLLHQYMPLQYKEVISGRLLPNGKCLVMDFVHKLADDYRYAAYGNE